MTQSLLTTDDTTAMSYLQQYADNPTVAWLQPFIQALQRIAAGCRDRSLADTLDLNYMMAAEFLWMIETLEKPH